MSAVKAPAPSRAPRHTAELDREILTRVVRGGLLICETELHYQFARHGPDRSDLLDLLADLEQRGLIESEMHFRLTAEGAARVPARDRPAPRAISSIPWSAGSLLRTASRPARGGPRAGPARPATRGKSSDPPTTLKS